jgi:ATP-dependent Clp protease ATP-binding subunit ClpA
MTTPPYSETAERILENAVYETLALGEQYTSTEHLLLGILAEGESNACRVLRDLRIQPEAVKGAIFRNRVGPTPASYEGLTPRADRILQHAGEEAKRTENPVVGSEHILIALAVEEEGLAGRILTREFSLMPDRMRTAAHALTPERPPAKARLLNEILRRKTQYGTETPMWQRFTERARRSVFFAQEEAGKLGEIHVSTEHLLLGLIRESDCVAARILDRMGISLTRVQREIERQVARGDGRVGEDMQLTPRSKRVIDLAYDEARQLNNNYIGTEHILLGLIREGEGLAGRVLDRLGATLDKARHEVIQLQNEASALVNDDKSSDEGVAIRGGQARITLHDRVRLVLFALRRTEPQLFSRTTTAAETVLAEKVVEMLDTDAAEPGDLGVAKAAEGQSHIEVAMDAETFLHLVAVYRAKDAHGYRAMVQGDQTMFLLPARTKIKRLIPPPGSDAAREAEGWYIRVLEGEYEGYAGWLFADRFERTGPDQSPFPPPFE